MNCSSPAPWFYVFVMHSGHIVSTPIYIISLYALFREKSKLFQTYKYYIIAHIITNLTSEFYVSYMWLPMTYLPYDVYRATGWLAQWGVSGILQFYILAQFIIAIGVSILEMFHHRFKVVVLHRGGNLIMKLPTYGLYVFRFMALVHFLTITWSTFDDDTIKYQNEKKDALFRGTIHVVMIVSPIVIQIYQMIFGMNDNNFSCLLLLSVAYHGLFSTCAMIAFTLPLRRKIFRYLRCCSGRDLPHLIISQVGPSTTFMEA